MLSFNGGNIFNFVLEFFLNFFKKSKIRNGSEIKVQIDAHLLTLYFLFFDLNSWAIRAKKQKI
jgi:hypothetical protein